MSSQQVKAVVSNVAADYVMSTAVPMFAVVAVFKLLGPQFRKLFGTEKRPAIVKYDPQLKLALLAQANIERAELRGLDRPNRFDAEKSMSDDHLRQVPSGRRLLSYYDSLEATNAAFARWIKSKDDGDALELARELNTYHAQGFTMPAALRTMFADATSAVAEAPADTPRLSGNAASTIEPEPSSGTRVSPARPSSGIGSGSKALAITSNFAANSSTASNAGASSTPLLLLLLVGAALLFFALR